MGGGTATFMHLTAQLLYKGGGGGGAECPSLSICAGAGTPCAWQALRTVVPLPLGSRTPGKKAGFESEATHPLGAVVVAAGDGGQIALGGGMEVDRRLARVGARQRPPRGCDRLAVNRHLGWNRERFQKLVV